MKEGFNGSRIIVLPKMVIDMMKKDPIMSQLHITDIGYFPRACHHAVRRDEGVEQYIFIYVMDGRGHYWFVDKDGKQQQYAVDSNQYFIIPANCAHAYWTDNDAPWTIYWIHFAGNLAQYYAEDAVSPQTVKPELYSRISSRTDHFEEIFNTLNAGYTMDNLGYASSLLNYYLSSLRYIKQYRTAIQNAGDGNGEINVVEAVIHYMKENLEKRLTLQDMAEYIGYSPSHFSSVFKQATGHAPLAYFNILKMEAACQMLDNTNMRVNQICYKIGFEDCYYFSRLFAKIVGMPPSKYREASDSNVSGRE